MTAATELRFGVLVHQDAPFPTLVQRRQQAEALGFDQLFVCDHAGDYRNLAGDWFDGWTVLAVAATQTARIRVGALVSDPILRHPVLLAKEAVTSTISPAAGWNSESGQGSPPSTTPPWAVSRGRPGYG